MREKKTYSYSTNEENFHGSFDTREEALLEATEEMGKGKTVWTALNVPYEIDINDELLIEDLQERAGEHAGEIGSEWLQSISSEEAKKLNEMLLEAFNKWASETNNEPDFFGVEDIQKHKE